MSYTGMMKLSEINIFVCNFLISIGNKLDGKVVIWMVCFLQYTLRMMHGQVMCGVYKP